MERMREPMDFSSISKLITADEDAELFRCQWEILENDALSAQDKLIRLAVLQCLVPIEDWENAAEMLRENTVALTGKNLLLAAYIAVTAFQMVRYKHVTYFLSLLKRETVGMDADFCAIAEFLEAEYRLEESCDKNGTPDVWHAKELLEASVVHSQKYVMNYLRLSEFCEGNCKKELIQKALANVKSISVSGGADANAFPGVKTVDPVQLSVEDLADPDAFFEERVLRLHLDDGMYRKLKNSVAGIGQE